MINFLRDKQFLNFVGKLLLIFAFCYLSSVAVIGLSTPGNYYSAFIDHYLNFISWIRMSLLFGTKTLLAIFGIDTYYASEFILRKVGGRGITLIYGCIGYGVLSFWIAFVLASAKKIKNKLSWLIGGLLLIWVINISRIALLLVATNNNWKMPLGWDHHTWFNIVAYVAIFAMIYYFDRNDRDAIYVKRSGSNEKN
ncbi:MAG: hypothetical protein ABIO04_09905 [Ferruginibacter sp.]